MSIDLPGAAAALRVGAHVSIAGGLERAVERAVQSGCDVIQVFTRSNREWAARAIAQGAAARWRVALARSGVDAAMVHGCYLVNLAAPRALVRRRSYRALSDELRRAALLGIRHLVIHPGSHGGDGDAAGVARIAAALDRLHDEQPDNPTSILLENTAGQGNSVGHRFEHMRDILGAMRAPERVGLCIDTCHTLAAGYDIRTTDGWEATFERLEAAVGCARVAAFHVNDSKTPLGSRVDRHEHLGRGFLGLNALRCLVNDRRFAGLPMVIETPRPSERADLVNLAILRALGGRARVGARAQSLAAEPLGPGAKGI
ncbi:MAG TPA: deoxyribonuclease IV [Kofleriaceae bacterium]|nr:deoxyribonuclease IV [Kofleriaceae bacterium]